VIEPADVNRLKAGFEICRAGFFIQRMQPVISNHRAGSQPKALFGDSDGVAHALDIDSIAFAEWNLRQLNMQQLDIRGIFKNEPSMFRIDRTDNTGQPKSTNSVGIIAREILKLNEIRQQGKAALGLFL
jgi:hypothetical protein